MQDLLFITPGRSTVTVYNFEIHFDINRSFKWLPVPKNIGTIRHFVVLPQEPASVIIIADNSKFVTDTGRDKIAKNFNFAHYLAEKDRFTAITYVGKNQFQFLIIEKSVRQYRHTVHSALLEGDGRVIAVDDSYPILYENEHIVFAGSINGVDVVFSASSTDLTIRLA